MNDEPKKRVLSKIEIFLLIIGLGILVFVLAEQGGCNLLKQTEQLEWVD